MFAWACHHVFLAGTAPYSTPRNMHGASICATVIPGKTRLASMARDTGGATRSTRPCNAAARERPPSA
jgi:hypothetical protein